MNSGIPRPIPCLPPAQEGQNARFLPGNHCDQGLTLVEMLIAAAVGSLVIAGIGSALLVSEVRVSGSAVLAQTLKDDSAQAANLMRSEIGQASLVETSGTYPGDCGSSGRNVRLAITGKNGAWRVFYATQSVPSSSTDWVGPFVLLRCGPTYSSTGAFNSGPSSESVVLDRLPLATSMTATLNKSSSTLARDARIDLRVQAGSSTPVDTSFDVRAAANPIFSLYDLYVNDNSSCSGGSAPCNSSSDPVLHYRPGTGTSAIVGSLAKPDIVYFPGPKSSYVIQRASGNSAACARSSCYVSGNGFSGVQMDSVNVLVFSDGELRL